MAPAGEQRGGPLRTALLLIGIGLGIGAAFSAVREWERTGVVGLPAIVVATVAAACLGWATAGTWGSGPDN